MTAAPPRYRGRFAPSPTGRMHLGNARSALLGFLDARAQGGQFLLRIEDLDRSRCRPEYTDALYRDLEYLGIGWDEPPVIQSERTAAYDEALGRLAAAGRSYECFCSRAEISRAASAPHGASDDGPRYPGTCRTLTEAERAERRRARHAALRFIPRPGVTRFTDLLQGAQQQDVEQQVGDFVVRKNDGVASYQLAVVVDDAASGITHVLRGDDLLGSTPRQLQLYEALNAPAPDFLHVPLLLGEDGKRMAKREGASAIADLRARNIPAGRVRSFLARSSGLNVSDEVSVDELRRAYQRGALRRAPTVVTEKDLEALVR